MLAQRPALGENGPSGRRRAPTFPQVNDSALLADSPEPGSCAPVFLPSRDVVSESAFFLPKTAKSSQARTLRRLSGASPLLGRGGRRLVTGALQSRDNVHPKTEHRLCLGELATPCPACSPEQRRRATRDGASSLGEGTASGRAGILLSRDMGRARCGFDALCGPTLGALVRCGVWCESWSAAGLDAWILVSHR